MREPFEPSEPDQPFIDPNLDGQQSDIEQQLRAIRPRAPQLNWNQISTSTAQAPGLQISLAAQRPGYSRGQLAAAVAAAWIVGVVVGGAGIFWSMSSLELARSQTKSTPLENTVKTTQTDAESNASIPEEPTAPADHQTPSVVARDPFHPELTTLSGLSSMAWNSDEPLGARSLTSSTLTGRLTTVRTTSTPAIASSSTTDGVDPSTDNNSPVEKFVPPPMSTLQQLMQQQLQENERHAFPSSNKY